MRSAAATAASTSVAGSPSGTATPAVLKSCLPWYSRRSIVGGSGDRGPERRGEYPNLALGSRGGRNSGVSDYGRPSRVFVRRGTRGVQQGYESRKAKWH